MVTKVTLALDPFDPAEELANFSRWHPSSGGIVSFLGQVREGDGVEALELTEYAPLTFSGMEDLAALAQARWKLDGLLIVHRAGEMVPRDPIVLVATAARHRRDAFEAADFTMDHLKSDSWFWKRELRNGHWHWIEPRAEDHEDLARWG